MVCLHILIYTTINDGSIRATIHDVALYGDLLGKISSGNAGANNDTVKPGFHIIVTITWIDVDRALLYSNDT